LPYTFAYCYNLVKTPNIPESVKYMSGTFSSCTNLVNAPRISNNVISMERTFSNCINLVNAPDMSNANSVTNLSYTFYGCSNLVNAPIIPNSVTNLSYTFQNCTNLTGDIKIYSENIANIYNCFRNSSLDKNVYIPIENNGTLTKTYNTFRSAGYKTDQRVNGVQLFNIANYGVENVDLTDWTYYFDPEDTDNFTVILNGYIGSNTHIDVPHIEGDNL
jgi:hypothetical protein